MIQQLSIIPCYLDSDKLKILKKLLNKSIFLASISTTCRGLPWQKKISKYGEPVLRGKNIGRYTIKGEIDNISIYNSEKKH